jgi:hypothetical protein
MHVKALNQGGISKLAAIFGMPTAIAEYRLIFGHISNKRP